MKRLIECVPNISEGRDNAKIRSIASVVEEVQDLIRWLRPFPRQSLLQLDYGDVADLFDETELALDESAADVAASLDALERGDFEASGVHYGRVAARWAHAQSLVFAN